MLHPKVEGGEGREKQGAGKKDEERKQ